MTWLLLSVLLYFLESSSIAELTIDYFDVYRKFLVDECVLEVPDSPYITSEADTSRRWVGH